ncbi:MAG: c-type cytochrome [Sphingomonadaceae bacterium]
MPRSAPLMAALLAAVVATPALAQAPAEIIKQRQGHFKEFGRAMKAISDEMRARSPDAAIVRKQAQTLAGFGPQIPGWFPRGTGPESGVATEALPAIWARSSDFTARANELTAAARALDAAAASGDAARMRSATAALGGTCKGCHDDFRLKK